MTTVTCPVDRCPYSYTPLIDETDADAHRYLRIHLEDAHGHNTAKPCKVDGCGQPSVDKSGIYSLLCATHKQEKKDARQRPVTTTTNGSLNELALELEEAHENYRQARGVWVDALERLRAAVQALEDSA